MLRSIPENFRFGKNLVQEIFFSRWGSVFEIFEWSKNRKNFFLLQITQNGPIRENKWFLAIFDFFPSHSGDQASRLSHFLTIFENEVLVDFFDFGWLDMFHIAYYDSTNCSRPLDNQ